MPFLRTVNLCHNGKRYEVEYDPFQRLNRPYGHERIVGVDNPSEELKEAALDAVQECLMKVY